MTRKTRVTKQPTGSVKEIRNLVELLDDITGVAIPRLRRIIKKLQDMLFERTSGVKFKTDEDYFECKSLILEITKHFILAERLVIKK